VAFARRHTGKRSALRYYRDMSQSPWQVEVAQLFEYTGQCLRQRHDRQAIVAMGTAVAYLQRAQDEGDRTAAELLALFTEAARDGQTRRFKFAPGELEELLTTSKTNK